MEIKEINSCKSCVHMEVCMFKNKQKEIIEKMNSHLSNYDSFPIFELRFLCKKYSKSSLYRE